MAKTFELSLVLGAALAGSFRATLTTAERQLGRLGQSLSDMRGLDKKLGRADTLSKGLATTRTELVATQREMTRLGQLAMSGGSAKLGADFDRARARSDQLKASLRMQAGELQSLKTELAAAGLATKDFAGQQARLGSAVSDLRGAQTRIQTTLAAKQANQDRRAQLRGQLVDAAGMGMAVVVPIKLAVDFESSMADVKKVMDFETPQQFGAMSNELLRLSTVMPMTATGFAEIAAAAGQSGIAREEVLQFAADAAKMGVAFDMEAGRSGGIMANWRAGMGLSQERVVSLADAVNHLSNNMNAKAGDLAGVIQRQGAVAMQAGFTETQVAALGAALLSSGASEEVAATALKNFGNALTRGASATDRQKEIYKMLGLTSKSVAKSMQRDAEGTTKLVLQRLAALPAHMRSAAVGDLFGEEAKGAITPLLANMENLVNAFDMVADKSRYAGSMEAEYIERSTTTANNLVLFQNRIKRIGITVGSVLLPVLNAGLGAVSGLLDRVTEFADAHPLLTKAVVGGTVGVLAFGAASIALGYIFTFVRGAILNAKLAVDGFRGGLALLRTAATGINLAGIVPAGGKVASLASSFSGLGTVLPAVAGGIKAMGLALVASPIGLIVAGIAGAALLIWKYWGPIKSFFSGLWEGITAAAAPAVAALEGALAPLGAVLGPVFKGLGAVITPVWDAIKGIGSAIGSLFEGIFSQAGPSDAARSMGLSIGTALGEGISAAVQGTFALFSHIGTAISGIFTDLLTLGASIGQGVGSALQAVLQAITTFSPIAAFQAVFDQVRAYLAGITLADAGRAILQTLADGVMSAVGAVVGAVKGVFDKVKSLMPHSDADEGPLAKLTAAGRAIPTTIGQGIAAVGAKPLTGPLGKAFGAARGMLGEPLSVSLDTLDPAGRAIPTTIGSGIAAVGAKPLTGPLGQAFGAARGMLGEPLSVSLDTLGPAGRPLEPVLKGLGGPAANQEGAASLQHRLRSLVAPGAGGSAAPAGPGAAGGSGGSWVINYSPQISVSGDAAEAAQQLQAGLTRSHEDLRRMVTDLMHQQRRVSFA